MQTKNQALGTMARADKGELAPPPKLTGRFQEVADVVSSWPSVQATVHWHFSDRSRIDGIDFYVDGEELGHLHLDGSLHLATDPTLGRELITSGRAHPFPYLRGWVCADVSSIGVAASVALFKRNYEHIVGAAVAA